MKLSALKQSLTTAVSFVILGGQFACQKSPVDSLPDFRQPLMHYTDFENVEVVNIDYTFIDIDADGRADFFFQAMPLGDAISPLLRLRLYVYSKAHTELLIGEPDDQTPALKTDAIVTVNHPGYTWYPVAASVLAEEIRPDNLGAVYWQGAWKDAAPCYLPIRLRKGGRYHYGWLQMSVDKVGRKLILQRAGLSTEADKPVKAGA